MGLASFVQTSFFGGEWSKAATGNLTDPRYKTAMAVCLNGLPVEPGSWTRRPGFWHAGATRGGNKGRTLSFDFQGNAPYSMEFTDAFLRFRNGRTLVASNDARTRKLPVPIRRRNRCKCIRGSNSQVTVTVSRSVTATKVATPWTTGRRMSTRCPLPARAASCSLRRRRDIRARSAVVAALDHELEARRQHVA